MRTPRTTILIDCPKCNGTGMVSMPFPSRWKMQCPICYGAKVAHESATWEADGARYRIERERIGEQIFQCAKRLGLTCKQVSDAERGLIDPAILKRKERKP